MNLSNYQLCTSWKFVRVCNSESILYTKKHKLSEVVFQFLPNREGYAPNTHTQTANTSESLKSHNKVEVSQNRLPYMHN